MCLAVPGRVIDVWATDGTRMARVDLGGTNKDVSAAMVPDLEIGDYTIVHLGFALQRLDAQTAAQTLAMFGIFDELPHTVAAPPEQTTAGGTR